MIFSPNRLATSVLAVPLGLVGLTASAGGLAQPVAEPVFNPPQPVIAAPAANWTGFYAGGSLGYGQLDGTGLGNEFEGALYGGHVGYNHDLGAYVLGAELEAAFGDLSDATSGLDFENVLRAKVRAGYDAGQFMPYVTAGYAQATVSAGGVDIDDSGYFYGAGIDYNLGNGITIGGEVLQHQFDDFNGGDDVQVLTGGIRVSYNF